MLTITELLEDKELNDLILLTPDIHITDQEIESVEVTETPDVEEHIPKNVLLLTTAMYFQNQQEALIPFIDSLIRARCIGLCIKTERFIGQIDQSIVTYATQRNFPLIHIPNHYNLGAIQHHLLSKVWGGKYDELNLALSVNKQLSRLVIKDAPLEQLIQELSKTLHSPLVLINPFGEILAHSRPIHPAVKDSNLWAAIKQVDNQDDLIQTNITLTNNQTTWPVTFVPIFHFEKFPHYLAILSTEDIPYPLSSFAIEQASLVLNFAIYKIYQGQYLNFKNESDFFFQFKEFTPQVLSTALQLNFSLCEYYQVIIINILDTLYDTPAKSREYYCISAIWLTKNIHHYLANAKVLFRQNQNELLLLIQEKPEDLKNTLERIHEAFKQLMNISLTFNVGGIIRKYEDIKNSYNQAKLILNDRIKTKNNSIIEFYHYRGLQYLINSLTNDEIAFYCTSTLGELAFPKDQINIDLRNTLKTYLENQTMIAETARALYIHRNTVKYRIGKCEKLLDIDINCPANSLNIRLALELADMIESS